MRSCAAEVVPPTRQRTPEGRQDILLVNPPRRDSQEIASLEVVHSIPHRPVLPPPSSARKRESMETDLAQPINVLAEHRFLDTNRASAHLTHRGRTTHLFRFVSQ